MCFPSRLWKPSKGAREKERKKRVRGVRERGEGQGKAGGCSVVINPTGREPGWRRG